MLLEFFDYASRITKQKETDISTATKEAGVTGFLTPKKAKF